ncbi:MAG: ribonuclease j1, ribonuclease [Candidatus Parcubacteria bacterium]
MNPEQKTPAHRGPRRFSRGTNRTRTRHTAASAATGPTAPAQSTSSTTRPATPHRRPQGGNRGGSRTATGNPRARNGGRSAAPGGRKRRMTNPPLQHRMEDAANRTTPFVASVTDADVVRVIPIAGVEEIGRNMIVVETKDDIIVIDAGIQFVSEENDAPGVNYILPNTQYLEERKDKIRGMIVTHGHLDHIGGIPYVMERIGNPPIFTQYLTSLMVLKRQEEFPHLPQMDMHVVEAGQRFMIGKIGVKSFKVTHSIPDSMGISIETPHGNIVITGDIKLQHENGIPLEQEINEWGRVGKDNNLLLIADSTNAEKEGFSTPEAGVHANIEEIIRNASGRIIVGTFASQFERLINIIKACERLGKKVVCEGRSIKTHIDIAILAKLLTVDKNVIIGAEHMSDYPADRIVILSTGAQGEEFAALMRIATDKHKYIRLTERDTIVFSSSVVPGNEISVQKLKDNIYRRGARIIHYRAGGQHVHSTGHGNVGELIWIQQQVKPRFFMPVHGHHSMLRCHAYAAIDAGFKKENIIIPDNGSVVDFHKGERFDVGPVKVSTEMLLVDGFTVGARQEVVLRDRLSLANDGMFVVIATVNAKTGKLRKSPDIISRGFVYLRESQQLLAEARILIKKTVERQTENMNPLNLDFVKDELTEVLSAFLMQRTNKTPMVIPVLIGI